MDKNRVKYVQSLSACRNIDKNMLDPKTELADLPFSSPSFKAWNQFTILEKAKLANELGKLASKVGQETRRAFNLGTY